MGMLNLPVSSQASLLFAGCEDELDAAVTIYNTGDAQRAQAKLLAMASDCGHLPQIQHNLGVLAYERDEWQQAQVHFNNAIENDTRTNMTRTHLQSLHQYQASIAFQKAMNTQNVINPPQLQMQTASLSNTIVESKLKTSLHNLATVDYELYAWWTSAADNQPQAFLEHYLNGYPAAQNFDAAKISWNQVNRDISFTAQDAVVVLSYRIDEVDKRTLLLLRLQNNRWKIYREAAL